jgi:glycosyltransferase involved in cell wall biosynthesis
MVLTMPDHAAQLAPFCDQIKIVAAPMYSVREQVEVSLAVSNRHLLHVPHYNVPLAYRGTLLVSIHDLTHILDETLRKTLKSRVYAQPMLRLAARKAAHIFTVSEYSKRQILEHLRISENKVTVIHNGVSSHLFPEPRQHARLRTNHRFGFDGPYILYVGNLKPHKNVSGLIRAFAILRSQGKLDHKLLIVGNDAVGRPQLVNLAADLGLNGSAIFVPGISSELLQGTYAGADLTVLPSFEEGFGLPIIESMACGTPVACSFAASMPEVAGAAAEYFDPHRPEAIAEAIERVLVSEDRWRTLQTLALGRAAEFTWEASVRRHYDVYKAFLN